jgi:TonB family protein
MTLLWFALFSLHVVDPLFPPNAVAGGTVVAELHFAGGKVKNLRILSGDEPFVGSVQAALAEWRLSPARDGDELVVVHFCRPYLPSVGNGREEVNPARPKSALPYPKTVISPVYPANVLGQGSVVLRTEISSEGRVTGVDVVRSVGSLTEPSMEAVRKWEFAAPKDDKGVKQASHAYGVFVYRFPILVR